MIDYEEPQQSPTGIVRCTECYLLMVPEHTCEYSKNGYCAVYRFQAAKDAITYNMHPSIHTRAKEESS